MRPQLHALCIDAGLLEGPLLVAGLRSLRGPPYSCRTLL